VKVVQSIQVVPFERSWQDQNAPFVVRFRAKRKQLKRVSGLFPESQGHILASNILFVPSSLKSGLVEMLVINMSLYHAIHD
jgi:hypothetical protein